MRSNRPPLTPCPPPSLQAIAAESKANAFQPPPADLELPCFVDVWSPLVKGELLHLGPLMDAADRQAVAAAAASGRPPPPPHPRSSNSAAVPPPSVSDAVAAAAASAAAAAGGVVPGSAAGAGGVESAAEHAAQHAALMASTTSVSESSGHLSAASESSLAPLSDYSRLRSCV